MGVAVAASQRSGRWLFGPVPDLLFGCGLFYALVLAAFSFAGPALRSHTPGYLLPLLVLAFSMPHYGGTLVRVYDQRRERRAYALFTVWITLALIALFVIGLGSAWVASLLLTVYLTWNPWHYAGQNYGLALMFLRRRHVDVGPATRRWLYGSFVLSFLLAAAVMHLSVGAAYSPLSYRAEAVTFLPVGITRSAGDVLVPFLGVGYAGCLAVSATRLLRRATVRDLVPAAALVVTQALWFSVPLSVHYFGWHTGVEPLDAQQAIRDYTLLIFVGHGLQYLWVTTYYARAAERWRGYARYWAKVAVSGAAVWTLPVIALASSAGSLAGHRAGLALLVASIVNLHHFVLDGAIWKLRNTRVAGVLIRREAEARPAGESGAPAPRAQWFRRVVWAVASAAFAAALLDFWAERFLVPSALASGDLVVASSALDRLRWIGADQPGGRVALGRAFARQGDYERAARQYERALAMQPAADAYVFYGQLQRKLGRPAAVALAYERALARSPENADQIHGWLAALALERGDEVGAAAQYRAALALSPSSHQLANKLAWLLATASDAAVREPDEAVRLAEALVEAAQEPGFLRTLAASYASVGRDEDAVRAASQAVERATAAGDETLVAELQGSLARYLAGHPKGAPRDGG